jgi:hypothetical protein
LVEVEHRGRIIEDLLEGLSLIEKSLSDESIPAMARFLTDSEHRRQFLAWVDRVSSSLEAAGMKEELVIWQRSLKNQEQLLAPSTSIRVQILSLRAVLLGFLAKLEHEDQVDSTGTDQRLLEEAESTMKPGRRYYSVRTGKRGVVTIELSMLCRLFCTLFQTFEDKGYFQEAFGYYCVDAGYVSGTLGRNVEAQVFRKLRKSGLWPIEEKSLGYSEDDLFDVIEFVYDHVSKPVEGYYHDFNDCGWHYRTFDQQAGREEFRVEINELLRDYGEGYELSSQGEILALAGGGLDYLLEAGLPVYDPENVEVRVNAAILKFRRYRSSMEDRRDAIRDLADVLEFLRPKLRQVLTRKDESDLFNIANNFGIRHHNEQQKTDYDRAVWYNWMFYYYLATIHAALRLISKREEGAA